MSPKISPVGIWVVIPAAGVGSRMKSQTPKQYLSLGGRTVLESTLEKFYKLKNLQGIVLALHPEDSYWKQLPLASCTDIHCVTGGNERSESVINALEYCQQHTDTDMHSWVLVHDAARPCVTEAKIEDLIELGLRDHSNKTSCGAILAIPAADTIKRAKKNKKILETVDRSDLWLAHTPQFFPLSILLDAVSKCRRLNLTLTDEASAIEAQGMAVSLLEDSRDNIKITLPEDLFLAETILKRRGDMA